MSHYPPGPTLWVPGQRLDAAALNSWFQEQPWGIVDVERIESGSSPFTTIVDISGLSISFTAVVDRLYKISFSGHVSTSVDDDVVDVSIALGDNTQLQRYRFHRLRSGQAASGSMFVEHEPGAGTAVYKIRAVRVAGTGSTQVGAGTTLPSLIMVEDIGPAH